MIKLKKLSKSYSKSLILNDLTVDFEENSIHGIVGANGAGKSTLLSCIAGIEAYEGEISYGHKAKRNNIAFLPTDPFFFEWITGREYLKFIADLRKIDKVNYAEVNVFQLPLEAYASSYSTGMKKKLALTALLLDEFDFYVLDEPFNGIDNEGVHLMIDIIRNIQKKGKTIFIASHFTSPLRQVCDHIYKLVDGNIEKQ
ncbi:ATP-binding cassette domain-containing protein [Belliella kenyensis]|uniref:ATP-binding cassette domain-containing protein n=1 Tax=Belliella kenyensis TaxID=1472724 RepID=A0ABV8ELR5_9BACT|nr:ATP-binding cassette domain-containing protein [Belliella kenyensis]MCH7400251.1 ATP-binding cassette domain-containing protein [Belliella kenyensis]MDN3604732.1 ATP-binding cassette domain-containing protein [Belliella kenyensis]